MIEQSTSQLKELPEGPPAVQTVHPSVRPSVYPPRRVDSVSKVSTATRKKIVVAARFLLIFLSLSISIYLSISLFPSRFPHSAPTRSCRALPFSPVAGFDREYLSFVTSVSTGRRSGWRSVGRLREGERAQPLPFPTPLPRPCGRPTRSAVATATAMTMAMAKWRSPGAICNSDSVPTPEEARHSSRRGPSSRRVPASSRFVLTGSLMVLSCARTRGYSRRSKTDVRSSGDSNYIIKRFYWIVCSRKVSECSKY